MTSRYKDMNQHDALYKAARGFPGGVEALAQRLGMSVDVLYKKLRPAVETNHVTYEEVSEIIENLEASGKPDLADLAIQAFNWRHGRVTIKLPDCDDDADGLLKQMVEIMGDEGILANAITGALAGDQKINDFELDEIEKDLQTCVSALVVLREKVRAKNRADFHRAELQASGR